MLSPPTAAMGQLAFYISRNKNLNLACLLVVEVNEQSRLFENLKLELLTKIKESFVDDSLLLCIKDYLPETANDLK